MAITNETAMAHNTSSSTIRANRTRTTISQRYRCDGPERLDERSYASAAFIAGCADLVWIMRKVPLVKDEDALLDGHRIWPVQNLSNQVSWIRLADGIGSGAVEIVITSDKFQFPE